MGLFGGSSSEGGDTGFASKLRTSSGSQDLDLSYGNDTLGGHGFSNEANAENLSSEDFAGALQMQGQMAQLFSKFHEVNETCWDMCVGDVGNSLSGRNQTCIKNCAERFVDTSLFLAQRFAQLAQKQGQ